jgi:hypothetical protein
LPGAADLTDISAAWQRRAFNKIFGIYGIGWGFDFESKDLDIRHEEVLRKGNAKILPFCKVYGKFWFVYEDDAGVTHRAEFAVTGANSNETGNEGYSLKGAITNAIGFGASMIGWQESVYLGARSHRNTEGFADGKDWADVAMDVPTGERTPTPDPNPPAANIPAAPAAPAVTPPVTVPASLKFSYCPDCQRTFTTQTIPSTCQCGSNNITKADSMEAARAAVAKLAKPVDAPILPKDPEKTLAENLGFESIKHIVCVACGYCEPVNTQPPACPNCGVVADKAWTKADNHAAMVEMSGKIKARLALAMDADASKKILESLKVKYNNDRRLLLQALAAATGRPIKNYSECSPAEMQKALDSQEDAAPPAAPAPVNAPAPVAAPAPKIGKLDLARMVFDAAVPLKLGGPRSVIAEIGKVANKSITSANQLNEAELQAVLENFKRRTGA